MYAPGLFVTACNAAGTRAQGLARRLSRKQHDTVITGYIDMGLIRDFLVLAKTILDA